MHEATPGPERPVSEISIWLAIALGGAVGACLRHGVHLLLQEQIGTASWIGFALPTLLVNLLGAALLGRLLGRHADAEIHPIARSFMAVGVLGSFTTYSGLILHSHALAVNAQPTLAVLYFVGCTLLGLWAFAVGHASGRVSG